MVNVIYTGDLSPCNVKVSSGGKISGWKTGEVREVGDKDAKLLLVQSYFSLSDGEVLKEEVIVEEVVEPEPVVEEVIEEDIIMIPDDLDEMLKDELLDFTAKVDIDADYSMTKEEIKEVIRKHFNN